MVYSNKFVMCVLVDGKVQKELANGEVHLPFETEFALRLRNKHDRRSLVKFFIDGENVSGPGYIIPANDFIDIKRHHDFDQAFKFVSLNSEDAVDYGKNGPNHDKVKGTVEARFYLEKERPVHPIVREVHHHHHHDHHHYPRPKPYWPPYTPYWNTTLGGTSYTKGMSGGNSSYQGSSGDVSLSGFEPNANESLRETKCSTDSMGFAGSGSSSNVLRSHNLSRKVRPCTTEKLVEDGCTVYGESTGQRWGSDYIDTEDTYTTLTVFLRGFEDEEAVKPKKRKTNKDDRIDDLEEENERLRRKLAEAENEQLKKKLKELEG